MSIFTFVRAAQSQNLTGAASVSAVRVCRCGAKLGVNASGAGVAGAEPSGLLMSPDDLREAAEAAGRSANRNARRNARWARCPRCGRRGRFAVLESALTRFVVAIPTAVVGAILGCSIGLGRQTIYMDDLPTVAALWGGGAAVVALSFAAIRRLRVADQSAEVQVVE